MKVWMLLFPDPTQPYASVRIAADTLKDARALTRALNDDPDPYADDVIAQYAGEADGMDAGVLLAVPRDWGGTPS